MLIEIKLNKKSTHFLYNIESIIQMAILRIADIFLMRP